MEESKKRGGKRGKCCGPGRYLKDPGAKAEPIAQFEGLRARQGRLRKNTAKAGFSPQKDPGDRKGPPRADWLSLEIVESHRKKSQKGRK